MLKKQVERMQCTQTIYQTSNHFILCLNEVNSAETTSDLLCTYTFLLTFCNLTPKLNRKLRVWNNIRYLLIHSETNLHAITSFNNLFQFAHLPRRDSSKPVFRQNNSALEIHCKSLTSTAVVVSPVG